jgi:phage repressor protein C with HTH and peptisase S24 domain
MSEDMKQRIRDRLEATGLSAEGASKKAGLSRSYLRLYLSRPGSAPRSDNLVRIAGVLETTPEWLLSGKGVSEARPGADAGNGLAGSSAGPADFRLADVRPPNRHEMPLDVPVLGTAAGSVEGAFQFEGGVIDYVRRPPALLTARDIYAIYVEGSSMEPEHRPGDLRFINPHKPPRLGDSVVVQLKNGEDGSYEAMIGHLVRRTGDEVVLGKLNPPSEVALESHRIAAIHKLLDMNDLFGV